MVKILFLIPGLSAGGAEKVLCNLVNNLDQSKFDITVQTVDKADYEKYLKKGIRYKVVNRCKSKTGRKIFELWFRFCAELGIAYSLYVRDDYDIEVAYLECAATKILAYSTNKKALKLAWVHCDLSKKEGFAKSKDKTKKYYKSYDKVVCVSEDARNGFQSLYGKEIETAVINNVIDEDEIFAKAKEKINLNIEKSAKIMVAVGRLTWQKNFDYLIETCDRLHKDGYNFYLYILGEGNERKHLEELIKDRRLENVVSLLGFTDNPYPYIKMADFVVCSSRYEGISTVAVEGLVLGKPVITTPCTGMQELLGDSEYGIIAGDTPDGLYNSIRKILDSPELERHYSEAAKKRGKDFSKSEVIEKTSEFFLSELFEKNKKSLSEQHEV